MGGVPCGVQDRVRERQEGFFAANECRRLWNDWPLVAALLFGKVTYRCWSAELRAAISHGWLTEGFNTEGREGALGLVAVIMVC
jgi:hypothetical protein